MPLLRKDVATRRSVAVIRHAADPAVTCGDTPARQQVEILVNKPVISGHVGLLCSAKKSAPSQRTSNCRQGSLLQQLGAHECRKTDLENW